MHSVSMPPSQLLSDARWFKARNPRSRYAVVPHASIMALNPFDADCPRLSDCSFIGDRLLCVTKACAGIYEPLNSSRTLVTPRSTKHGLRCTMLLLPEHFPWMIACRTPDGEFDALNFVLAFLQKEQKVVSYGCYVMNVDAGVVSGC